MARYVIASSIARSMRANLGTSSFVSPLSLSLCDSISQQFGSSCDVFNQPHCPPTFAVRGLSTSPFASAPFGDVKPHPSSKATSKSIEVAHPPPAYDMKYLEGIRPSHKPPTDIADRIGLAAVSAMRLTYDKATGYGDKMTENKWLQRMIFLETVAGVPGMVGGMLRHLHSLRLMKLDKGWIPTLLEEAENERMHLLTFLEVKRPGPLFRLLVLAAQGIFFNLYFVCYLLSPKICHAFVGYLEEEAVRTYTHALADIDAGKLWANKAAPDIAKQYWSLAPNATMRDVILAVRADELCHSHVNHTLKSTPTSEANPFAEGKSMLP